MGNVSIISATINLWAVFTMLFAFIFLGQRLSILQFLGVILIIAGVALVTLKVSDIKDQNIKLLSGVKETIKILNQENIPLYVVSGSDEEELNKVFYNRGIKNQFEMIYGSPKNKIENLEIIQKLRGNLDNGLVLGDSKSDMLAAEFYNLDFIYIHEKSEWESGKSIVMSKGYPMYGNFLEILNK